MHVSVVSFIVSTLAKENVMADQPDIHFGENSPEKIAYDLTHLILISVEDRRWNQLNRAQVLRTYAQCLYVVRGGDYVPTPDE